MNHKPLLSQTCDYCGFPFPTVSPRARFCCDDHRTAYWKRERKAAALIDALMAHFRIAEQMRKLLVAAVRKAMARFFEYAERLGFSYHTKKYVWMKGKTA